MPKSKKQLADEAWLRLNGQLELVANVPQMPPKKYGELQTILPATCTSCRELAGASARRPGGLWSSLRTALTETDGLIQCCACSYIIHVTRAVWQEVSLRNSKAYTDDPKAALAPKKRDSARARQRGAG